MTHKLAGLVFHRKKQKSYATSQNVLEAVADVRSSIEPQRNVKESMKVSMDRPVGCPIFRLGCHRSGAPMQTTARS